MASLPCGNCGSSDAVEAYDNGDFCFSCHININARRLKLESDTKKQKNPKPVQLIPITDYWINWLKQRGIKERTINEFNIQYDQLSQSIAYPVKAKEKIVGYQLRDKDKKIKTIRYAKEEEPFLFEARADDTSTVVVVEDPISAMRIWQDARINAVALLGTNLSTVNKLYLVTKYKQIIAWMDGDLAGYKAAQKIINDCALLSQTKLLFTKFDPKDFLPHHINIMLASVISELDNE